MSDPASRDRRLSVEEYLRREERARVRHEYVAGHVYAMTGATIRHNKIVRNMVTALHAAAGGGPCQVFVNDVKVRIGDERFYYPDVVVACAPVDDDAVYVTDPCLIVEVTSPSTRATDRREKLLAYGRLPSLQAYLIVDHRRRRVEWYVPDGATGLRLRDAVAGDGAIDVPCPRVALPLATIYAGVTLPVLGERAPAGYRTAGDPTSAGPRPRRDVRTR
jgi:Uma2 family endonuclease